MIIKASCVTYTYNSPLYRYTLCYRSARPPRKYRYIGWSLRAIDDSVALDIMVATAGSGGGVLAVVVAMAVVCSAMTVPVTNDTIGSRVQVGKHLVVMMILECIIILLFF